MNWLLLLQLLVSVFLLLTILVQANGTSLGRAFGGGASYHTRRGAEKAIFNATIFLGFVFVFLSLLNLVLNK
jgi:preprotein translocase subunit SecG